MSEESLSEMYYKHIKESNNPVPLFVGFFTTIFNCNNKDQLYPMFARLYKVYDKEVIYFSILDCFDMDNFSTDKPYGILAYFCKKRLESKYKSTSSRVNLDKVAEKVINKEQKKLKIPSIEVKN